MPSPLVADDVSRYDAVVAGVAALLAVALVVVLVLFVVQQRSRRRRAREVGVDEAQAEREHLERITRRMQDVEARLRELAARDAAPPREATGDGTPDDPGPDGPDALGPEGGPGSSC